MARLPVYPWPEQRVAALAGLAEQHLVVVSVVTAMAEAVTPASTRQMARAQIRLALTDLLSGAFACPAQQINLEHEPGQPPGRHLSLILPEHRISLSISHEHGMSIAAIAVMDGVAVADGTGVGVDLLLIDPGMDWQAVAQLYLGMPAYQHIRLAPPSEQAACFAQLWANQEARLKAHGMALTEWSPRLAQDLAACDIRELDLPPAYAGALALRKRLR